MGCEESHKTHLTQLLDSSLGNCAHKISTETGLIPRPYNTIQFLGQVSECSGKCLHPYPCNSLCISLQFMLLPLTCVVPLFLVVQQILNINVFNLQIAKTRCYWQRERERERERGKWFCIYTMSIARYA